MNNKQWYVSLISCIVITCAVLFALLRGTMKAQELYKVDSIDDVKTLVTLTAREMPSRITIYLKQLQEKIDQIIAIPDNERTFENTMTAFDHLGELSNALVFMHVLYLLKEVSPQEAIRSASRDGVQQIQNFIVDHISNNKKLYNAIKAYAQGNAQKEDLKADQKYFLTEIMDGFKRAGLELSDEKLEKVRSLQKELADLSLSFSQNIASDQSFILVQQDELAGLDDELIKQFEKVDGKYKITVDYPTFFAVIQNSLHEPVRKKIYETFKQRGYPDNEKVLKKIIATRDELARTLGFESYAALDLDDQMIKSPQKAYEFLAKLTEKSLEKEKQELDAFTSELPQSVEKTAEGKIKPWDLGLIENQYKRKHFNIDESKLKEYFPLDHTLKTLFEIYQQFLPVYFEEISVSGLWDPSVRLLKIYNKDQTELLGYLFLDLFPRPHKYSHAAFFGMIPALISQNGKHLPGVGALVCNFPKPTDDKPSLLKRDDVKTFFHEFGHALHAFLGAQQIASFSGTNVKRDFVELPSQMLEEWLYDKEILKMVSSHYKTGESIPEKLIEKIVDLKQLDSGLFTNTQSMYSQLALDLFKAGKDKDPYAIYKQLYTRYRPAYSFNPQDHFYAAFGHLTGYGAKYYGYLWSRVFALDLFDQIKKEGLLNPTIGHKYSALILEPGGSKDPNELLYDFLGRVPTPDAFFKHMGLE